MESSNLIKRFPKNELGRDFVVGDIHGCFSLLQSLLDKVIFNCDVDRLFSVGDLVDRGDESNDVLKWLSRPWFHAVKGNHEDMLIGVHSNDWPKDNYNVNGGKWFLTSSKEEQDQIAAGLDALPIAIQIDTSCGLVGLLHADVLPSGMLVTHPDNSTDVYVPSMMERCMTTNKSILEK